MMLALRRPPMPWQVDYLNVAGELVDDGDGGLRLAYPYVVVIVPRRAGKTAGMLGGVLQRCTLGPLRNVYTAQTRGDAAKALREDWTPLLNTARLSPHRVKVRRSQGSESLTWVRTQGTLSLFAPTETAVHGSDVDVAVVDEAWAFDTLTGDQLEAALQPAQATRERTRQTWIVSAGGTHLSTWLARWRDLGEAGTPGVALIEYGADPEVDDLEDPAVWARVHPAVGHTISIATLEGIRSTMSRREEFHRAFLGVWTVEYSKAPALSPEAWDAARDPEAAPRGQLAFGLEVAPDSSSATIVAAGTWVDGTDRERRALEVVAHEPGTAWIPAAWRRLRGVHRARLYADSLGPSVAVVDELRRRRLPVEVTTTGEYSGACQAMLDELTGPDGPVLAHRGQPILDTAARVAVARRLGDRWVWRRDGPEVVPLIAATLAAHGARRPVRAPYVRSA